MVLISFLGIILGIFEIDFPLPEAFPILESTVLWRYSEFVFFTKTMQELLFTMFWYDFGRVSLSQKPFQPLNYEQLYTVETKRKQNGDIINPSGRNLYLKLLSGAWFKFLFVRTDRQDRLLTPDRSVDTAAEAEAIRQGMPPRFPRAYSVVRCFRPSSLGTPARACCKWHVSLQADFRIFKILKLIPLLT